MNKSIKYILLLCATCLIGFTSCSNEDKDLFDQSSAHRLTEALKNCNEVLCSSTDGWAMEYFPNENQPGHTFLMQFDKNSAVKMASKNSWTGNKILEKSSLFEMIADNGPVLTFNTYNEVIHFFANPEDIPSTDDKENGRGFEGDYEFVVIKAEADLVTLKGKKRNLDIFLRRLPAGQVWSEYFASLETVDKSLFSSKIKTIVLNAGGEKYTITNASNHIMHLVPDGGDPISQTLKAPFIVLQDGIRFVKPFTGYNDAFSIQSFKIAEDGSLICTDDNESTIKAPALSEIINAPGFTWRINKEDLGGSFATAYEKVVAESKSQLSRVFQYFEFKVDAKTSSNALAFRNGTTNGLIFIDVNIVSETKIAFTSEYKGDNNGNVHMTRCPSYKEFVELLVSSEFGIASASAICPTKIKLTSINNPSDYIIVDAQ